MTANNFLKTYKKLLGKSPAKVALDAKIVETRYYPDYIREKVIYKVEKDEEVPAYFLIPKNVKKPVPAVVVMHQHGGQFGLGKSEVVGRIGLKNQQYAVELVKQGYAVLAADSRCFEERMKYWDGDGIYTAKMLLSGRTMAGMQIWDVSRAVDFLETRTEVDPSRIGIIGHSMGCMQTLNSTPLEKRIKVAVASCGAKVLEVCFKRGDGIPASYQIPGLMQYGDLPDIYSLIAPRPLLILGKRSDKVSTLDEIKVVKEAVSKRYKASGKANKFKVFLEDGGHDFSPTLRAEAYKWLKKWL